MSRVCFEPKVGVQVLQGMLQPQVDAQRLRIVTRSMVDSIERDETDRIHRVTIRNVDTGQLTVVEPRIVLDATELGDLMPLANIPYRSGMEAFAETGEPSAPPEGNQEAVQSFTYTFAVELRPGENHVIPKPPGYEANKRRYGYRGYKMFSWDSKARRPFWNYRRLIAAHHFDDPAFPNDIAMINWGSNDYTGGNIIDAPEHIAKQRHEEAKLLSLGFLYWLQTEAPRDDGGFGYPEFKLRPDIMGTDDGLSQFPYIRESRRLRAIVTVHEEDLVTRYNPGPRARLWPDSVGIGLYHYIDVHHCCNTKLRSGSGQRIHPYQVPLRALLTDAAPNFIASAKNIGTTHITNGAFRMHPVEWNIGESAGALAAFALERGVDPLAVSRDPRLLRSYQNRLALRGIPLFWFTDLHPAHPDFAAIQYLGVRRILDVPELPFRPEDAMDEESARAWSKNAGCEVAPMEGETRAQYAGRLYLALLEMENLGGSGSAKHQMG